MTVLATARLVLREFTLDDAPFASSLLQEPSFLRHIGDRGVRTDEEARRWLRDGPLESYRRNGFGLYLTSLAVDATPIGMCGLLKRPVLDDVDIGFAFRPAFWGQGYAFEAASAVMAHGRDVLVLPRIVAIASPDNVRSAKLLERLGLRLERRLQVVGGNRECDLFGTPPGWGRPDPAAGP